MRKEDPRVDQELEIIAEPGTVPSNGLCVRKDLDTNLKNRLREYLLNLDKDPDGKAVLIRFGAIRFIDTTARDYEPVFDMAKQAGIDIRTYQYRNE